MLCEKAKFGQVEAKAARGLVTVELKDPLTGKVKHRESGENYIYQKILFGGACVRKSSDYGVYYYTYATPSWLKDLSDIVLVMTDSVGSIDAAFPFVLGNVVGYGCPSANGRGNYRGAYNSQNQVLAQISQDKLRWRFQYDFTTAQANGTIGTIGLTHQFAVFPQSSYSPGACFKAPFNSFRLARVTSCNYTCDGRYSYACSSAGVVTRYDNYSGAVDTYDVSSYVGTENQTKIAGYAPATGKYYVYAHSSTAANRKLHEFSDNAFSSRLNVYTISNASFSSVYPMYVYGTRVFLFTESTIYHMDFAANSAVTSQAIPTNIIISNEGLYPYFGRATIAKDNIAICSIGNRASPANGIIYDMDARAAVGYLVTMLPDANNQYTFGGAVRTPFFTDMFVPGIQLGAAEGATDPSYPFAYLGAVAAKRLETPIVKTGSYGMTVTYELEVYWSAI